MDTSQWLALVAVLLTIIGAAMAITWKVGSSLGDLGVNIAALTSEVSGLKEVVNDHREDFVRETASINARIHEMELNCRGCNYRDLT